MKYACLLILLLFSTPQLLQAQSSIYYDDYKPIQRGIFPWYGYQEEDSGVAQTIRKLFSTNVKKIVEIDSAYFPLDTTIYEIRKNGDTLFIKIDTRVPEHIYSSDGSSLKDTKERIDSLNYYDSLGVKLQFVRLKNEHYLYKQTFYDKIHRPVKIISYSGQKPNQSQNIVKYEYIDSINTMRKFHYNSYIGRKFVLKEEEETMIDSTKQFKERWKNSYSDEGEKFKTEFQKIYYNRNWAINNEVDTVWEHGIKSHSIKYYYDRAGHILKEIQTEDDGSKQMNTWTYDSKGNCILRNIDDKLKYRWKYDAKGNITDYRDDDIHSTFVIYYK